MYAVRYVVCLRFQSAGSQSYLQALEEEEKEEAAAANVQPSIAKKGKKAAPSFADLDDAEDSDKEESAPEDEEEPPVQRSKGKKSKGNKSGVAFAALSMENNEVVGGEESREGDSNVSQVQTTHLPRHSFLVSSFVGHLKMAASADVTQASQCESLAQYCQVACLVRNDCISQN